MATIGYVGNKGSGKTLNLVYDVQNDLKRGMRVVSNIPISFVEKKGSHYVTYKAVHLQYPDDFKHALVYWEDCEYVIDEAGIFMPAFRWPKFTEEMAWKFQQQRHFGADFLFTCPSYNDVVIQFRKLSDYVYNCYKKPFLNMPWFLCSRPIRWPVIYYADCFNPRFFQISLPGPKHYERYFRFTRILYPSQSRRAYRAYDTKYIVGYSMWRKQFFQSEKPTAEQIKEMEAHSRYGSQYDKPGIEQSRTEAQSKGNGVNTPKEAVQPTSA